MKQSTAGKVGIIFLAAILGACTTGTDVKQTGGSGFLRDYSLLQQTKDTQGTSIRAWVSPKLAPSNYDAVLFDPIVFYPEPRPNEQVSAETLQQILAYSNDTLKRAVGERFRVVDRPGPGVLRIRIAITGVAAQGEGLRPYQFVPIAFVATMAARASMGTPQRAFLVVEVEGTDSVTGELLAQRIRVATGERLANTAGQKVITLDAVKPLLDEMAAGAFPTMERYVKPK
jgi:hypothetical protein